MDNWQEGKELKQALTIIWLFLVAFSFSVMLHSTDSAIGDLETALSASNIVSVILIALISVFPMSLCLLLFRLGGWIGFIITLLAITAILGIVLGFAGSTAQTKGALVISSLGMTGLLVFINALGSLPLIIFNLRKRKTD